MHNTARHGRCVFLGHIVIFDPYQRVVACCWAPLPSSAALQSVPPEFTVS